MLEVEFRNGMSIITNIKIDFISSKGIINIRNEKASLQDKEQVSKDLPYNQAHHVGGIARMFYPLPHASPEQ